METMPTDPTSAPALHPGAEPVHRSALPLPLARRGKVRDVYEAGPGALLLVASDRVSAFDVVMGRAVPRKGEVLNLLTAWWAARVGDLTAHHVLTADPDRLLARLPALADADPATWARRSMLVKRTEPVPVECVVRGYLSGSAWREYRTSGTLAGEPLPPGLVESDRLDAPLFSPATKADEGHDENIPFERMARELGQEAATRLRELSLALYARGAEVAADRGILLADTKFEFGHDEAGRLLLIDEILTPDSSRYWPAGTYAPGRTQSSLDKQPIRDYLDALADWDKAPPPPELPDAVVSATSARYLDLFRRLTGEELDAFRPPTFEEDR